MEIVTTFAASAYNLFDRNSFLFMPFVYTLVFSTIQCPRRALSSHELLYVFYLSVFKFQLILAGIWTIAMNNFKVIKVSGYAKGTVFLLDF